MTWVSSSYLTPFDIDVTITASITNSNGVHKNAISFTLTVARPNNGYGPPTFANLSSNLNKYNLLEMANEGINLGNITSHDITGKPIVVSFRVFPASFAYHIYFSLEKTSLFVDY